MILYFWLTITHIHIYFQLDKSHPFGRFNGCFYQVCRRIIHQYHIYAYILFFHLFPPPFIFSEEVSETLCLFACHAVTDTSETLLYEIPISIKLWNQFSYRRGGPSSSSSSSSSSTSNMSKRGLNEPSSTPTSFPSVSPPLSSSSDPTNTTTPNAKSLGGVDGYGNSRGSDMRKEAMEAHQGPFPLNPC